MTTTDTDLTLATLMREAAVKEGREFLQGLVQSFKNAADEMQRYLDRYDEVAKPSEKIDQVRYAVNQAQWVAPNLGLDKSIRVCLELTKSAAE